MSEAAKPYNWKRDWKTWALIVSVAFNLVFAGLTATRALGFWRGGPFGPEMARGFIERKLPEQDRAAFRAIMGDGREQRMAEIMKAMRDDRRILRDALKTEPFDREKFAAATAGARAHVDAFSREVEETMLAAAERLSPEGRARLADMGPRGPKFGDRERRKHD